MTSLLKGILSKLFFPIKFNIELNKKANYFLVIIYFNDFKLITKLELITCFQAY